MAMFNLNSRWPTLGLLSLAVAAVSCNHALTPEDLAKRYPEGRYTFPPDVEHELQTTLKPREFMPFMHKYDALIQPHLDQLAIARGAPLRKQKQEEEAENEKENDALTAVPRRISSAERRFVGSWSLVSKGGFICEGPGQLNVTFKSNGLGTGSFVDKYGSTHQGEVHKDYSAKGALAWDFDGDQLKIIIKGGFEQSMKARRSGDRIMVIDEEPPLVFEKR